jgi:hypothetical protein
MAVDFKKIHEAVKKRDEFLNEHPELKPLQEEISQILNSAGTDAIKRNIILQKMLLDTWWKITRI